MSKAKVELTGAQYELTEITDLLERCDRITSENRSIWWYAEEWQVIDWNRDFREDLVVYHGPSLLEALRVLVGKEAQS